MNFGNNNNQPPAPMGAIGNGMGGIGVSRKAPAPMGEPAPSSGVVSLSKGQKVSLSKMAPSLTKVMVGLGWDTNKYSGGFDFDLDASAFLCEGNNVCKPENFVFYNNTSDVARCCTHQGDNRTGEGEGDDEQILIDLSIVPANINKIAITVTIFESDQRRQNFGNVSNSFIRLVDNVTGKEFLRYDLGEDFSVETAIVVAEIYRHGNEWKFNAIGSGFAGGLAALCSNYGIDTE